MLRERPRAVFVGKTGASDVYGRADRHESDVYGEYLDVTTVGSGSRRAYAAGSIDTTIPLVGPGLLGGALFYVAGPVAAIVSARRQGARHLLARSPYEAAALIAVLHVLGRRRDHTVVVDLHGDPQTASRLYGSRLRRVLSPLADRAARAGMRGADLVRVCWPDGELLARAAGYRGPVLGFLPFSDYAAFTASPVVPVPRVARVLFVGALERYKAVDVLIRAWGQVVEAVPGAQLDIVGSGTLESSVRRRAKRVGIDASVVFHGRVDRGAVAGLLDECRCLVLPSRDEGLPRVILEAQARGRAVVATSVGGVPSILREGRTGLLVRPEDAAGLAAALVRALAEPGLAERLGRAALAQAREFTPHERHESDVSTLAHWLDGASVRG